MAKPRGFFAPAGTDAAVLSYISEKMAEVCEMPEFQEAMANLGFTVAYVDGPAAKERAVSWAESLTPVLRRWPISAVNSPLAYRFKPAER